MSTIRPRDSGDRAVSEMTAVATLVGLAILLVVGIGLNVLLLSPSDTGPPEGNFTYQHISQANTLVITYEKGDKIRAGDLYVEGQEANATWAALAGKKPDTMIKPGAVVQVGKAGPFGAPVRTSSRIRIVWRNATLNESAQLSQWSGGGGL